MQRFGQMEQFFNVGVLLAASSDQVIGLGAREQEVKAFSTDVGGEGKRFCVRPNRFLISIDASRPLRGTAIMGAGVVIVAGLAVVIS